MANYIKCIECGTQVEVREALGSGDNIDCPECMVRMIVDKEGGRTNLSYAKGYEKSKRESAYSDQDFGSYD